jgi:N-methylhydantoinase B/oxoprolinase/acetone carboxylase alpha subunit
LIVCSIKSHSLHCKAINVGCFGDDITIATEGGGKVVDRYEKNIWLFNLAVKKGKTRNER